MKNLPVNKTGYLKGAKTAKNPVNVIPSNLITTQGMAFPIKANGKTLYPNTGQYKFNTPYVVETPLKQNGVKKTKTFNFKPNTSFARDNISNVQGQESAKTTKFKLQQAKDYKDAISEIGTPKMGQAEDKFRARYETSTHRFRYDNDAKYRKQIDKKLKEAEKAGRPLLKENVKLDPNAMFMLPIGLKGQAAKDYQDFHKGIIQSALPIPGIPKFLRQGKNASKVNFSKYLTQEEAVAARAERMLEQENKWVGQNNQKLIENFKNARNKHNSKLTVSDWNSKHGDIQIPENLGVNKFDETVVYKDAPLSEANKARLAAHETGHYYRNTFDEGKEWNSFFDFSPLTQKKRNYLAGKGMRGRGSIMGDEIRERAAQLKDYIAQKNNIPLNKDFKITESQLDDAIENYVKDTGLDNSMSPMLSSLTDKKGFLKAMNKYALGVIPAAVVGKEVMQKKEYQDGADELSLPDRASEAAKFTYRIKDKKRRDTQVADMYNNTLDSFRGDTTGAKRHFKSFFTDYGSERYDGVRPITGYYGFDKKDYNDKTLDSLGREWHKQMRVSKKQKGTKNAKADYNNGRTFGLSEGLRKRIYDSVNPDEYPIIETIPAIGRFTSGRKVTDEESKNVTQADKDAWAFYMGIPQKEKTVTRSKYTPTENKTKNTKYYTVRNAYPAFEDSVISNASKAFTNEKEFWKKASDKIFGNKDTKNKRTGVESSFRPLQNVTYSKGKDKKGNYYSIYDTYDFDVPYSDKIGKPYEIYDRVYYDPKTGKPLNKKKQGSKDMKPLIKYKDGSKGVSLAFSRGEKDPKGGLTQKGVDKYNRATGGNLKMAVTTPPSKLKPGSKAANRRKSFCARMSGVKGPMAKNGKPTRKALALRKWNC